MYTDANASSVSNTVKCKLQRISKLDENTGIYTASAFSIAQFGKDFARNLNERISGEELLDMAWMVVKGLQYAAGGIIVFPEAEKKEKLPEFYQENGFREFDIKIVDNTEDTGHELAQMLKIM